MPRHYSLLSKEQNQTLDEADLLRNELATRNNEYMVFHHSTKNIYSNHAETDAQNNIPSTFTVATTTAAGGISIQISEREQEIIADYENKFHDLTDKATSILERLSTTFRTEYGEYETNPRKKETELQTESAIQQTADMAAENSRYTKEIGDLNREKHAIETTFQTAKSRFEPFIEKFDRNYTDGAVPFIRNWWLHAIVIVFLGSVEIPFNKVVFDHLVTSDVQSYIFSAATGIFMILGAHFAGMFYKRSSEKGKIIFAVIITLFLLVVCWGIGVFRYMEVHNIPFKNIDKVKIGHLLKDFSFWFFFVMSLLVAVVGVVISFSTHDSSTVFERAFKEFDQAQQRYDTEIDSWNSKNRLEEDKHNANVHTIQQRHLERLAKIPTQLKEGLDIYQDFKALYNSIVRLVNDLEDAMIKGANETASAYRSINMARRPDKTTIPSIWSSTYSLKFVGEDIARKFPAI